MKHPILNRSIRSLLFVPLFLGTMAFADEAKMPTLRVDEQALKRDENSSYAPVIERVAPSVVTISTEVRADKLAKGNQRGMNDPMFRRFFGMPDLEDDATQPKKKAEPKSKKMIPAGLGSGVIVSPDGYILTNHHVVAEADEIKVTLADGKTEYTAKKVASDEGSDIAVIKIEATTLSPITFADSDKTKVGDVAIAIGTMAQGSPSLGTSSRRTRRLTPGTRAAR